MVRSDLHETNPGLEKARRDYLHKAIREGRKYCVDMVSVKDHQKTAGSSGKKGESGQ